jgi:cysteine-rich repeat protein
MKRLNILILAMLVGCGDCDDKIHSDRDVGSTTDIGLEFDSMTADAAADSMFDAMTVDASSDLGSSSDAQTDSDLAGSDQSDASSDMLTGICGNNAVELGEACDDGNTDDGDYCDALCETITGSCGDGTLQGNETCDDGVTTACSTTHDGGDASCLPNGACAAGFVLNGAGACVSNNTTGLTVPCSNGTGYSMFKFHYDNGSTSARIDVWDATCSYSFASNSACNVREVYPGFGDISRTSEGYPIATSTHYIRVRFSAAGLNFNAATLYVQGRSYATGSSTTIRAWSPLYGEQFGGPVDNDFVYDWYGLDWTGFLSPNDQPSLTAVQIYAYQGSSNLAIKGVELCVE